MHYRARTLGNISLKIAHFPVSSDLKPSEEAPIVDMIIKEISKLRLSNGTPVCVVGLRGDGEHRNDEALTTSSRGNPTTMQALAARAKVTSELVVNELVRKIGSTYVCARLPRHCALHRSPRAARLALPLAPMHGDKNPCAGAPGSRSLSLSLACGPLSFALALSLSLCKHDDAI